MNENKAAKLLSHEIDKAIIDDIIERYHITNFLQDESVFTGGVVQRENIQLKVNDVMKTPKATE